MSDAVIIESKKPAKAAVIWLHGLGADGHDFESIVPELTLSSRQDVRFIFPHAPMRPITLNEGYVMRGWYDIYALDMNAYEDEPGILDSVKSIHKRIEAQMASGIPAERILLAGFSQGGAIALLAGLTFREKVAGILALSTYVPLPGYLQDHLQPHHQSIPILMCHGTLDEIITFPIAEMAGQYLKDLGCAVDFKTYSMAHTLCAQELDDINTFFDQLSL